MRGRTAISRTRAGRSLDGHVWVVDPLFPRKPVEDEEELEEVSIPPARPPVVVRLKRSSTFRTRAHRMLIRPARASSRGSKPRDNGKR